MRRILAVLLITLLLLGSLSSAALAAPAVLLDGRKISFDVPPMIENGRTLVPLRCIAEALGAEVGWDHSAQSVIIIHGTTTIKLKISSPTALKNDRRLNLEVPPRIVQGRTMVPLRFISEAMGAAVFWNSGARTVSIKTSRTGDDAEILEKQVFELVNDVRAERGLPPFQWDEKLARSARKHSQDMVDRSFFSHTNPDGESPFDRMREAGISYRAAAENIAAGQPDAASVLDSWMNSPGHKQNILGNYRYLGVGVAFGGDHRVYYTQNFYSP